MLNTGIGRVLVLRCSSGDTTIPDPVGPSEPDFHQSNAVRIPIELP